MRANSGFIDFYRISVSLIRVLLLSLMPASQLLADISESDLGRSLVPIEVMQGHELIRQGSGFVVQADRFSAYIVTNAELVKEADSLVVSVAGTGAQLIAQSLRLDLSNDYALLKVNGLELPALLFARDEPTPGEVVWSAARQQADQKLVLNKGLLRTGFKLSQEDSGWYQHTAALGTDTGNGGVLLNECGEVIGLNFSRAAGDGSIRSIDQTTLKSLLVSQNVRITEAAGVCISEVGRAREKADLASAEAQRAKEEAQKAQAVARNLEKQLKASKRSSDDLVTQTRIARERAESAILAAEEAEAKAENTRRELEEKTSALREETQALVKAFEDERQQTEERFQEMLSEHQEAAASRETILMVFAIVLIIVLIIVVILLLRSRVMVSADRPARSKESGNGETVMHREELSEYVLDGRDDDGIRYLLRISGDQLVNSDGVIIGRNPKDSPYIINHADVSRKHARMKVMKNRVFIEDLGSTNGTSINGQSIDDKGLVSVDSGDQIIIGSVVMKLRVMEG